MKSLVIGALFCPKCSAKMLPNCDGEWFTCPNRCVIDLAPEDCAHLYREQ